MFSLKKNCINDILNNYIFYVGFILFNFFPPQKVAKSANILALNKYRYTYKIIPYFLVKNYAFSIY